MSDKTKTKSKAKKPMPKDKTHYRIFRIEKDEQTGKEVQVNMTKFWAKNDDEAYSELKEYRKVANKAYTYYYGTTGYFVDRDKDGNELRFDTMEEEHAAWEKREGKLKMLWLDVTIFFEHLFDIRYKIKDIWHVLRTKHQRNESWSLDYHILDDLIFNIPLLIKDKNGVPTAFCEKAAKLAHKGDPSYDPVKEFEKDPGKADDYIDSAKKLWDEELNKLLLYVKLYCYYRDFGIVDNKDPEQVKFHEKYKYTLPYKPGTYKTFDYKKLSALQQRYWSSIWNWMKEYGQSLWT